MDYKKEIYKICDEMTTLAFDISKPSSDILSAVSQFTEDSKRIETSFRSIYKIMCDDEDVQELLKYETERTARNMCAMNYVIFSRIK